MEKEKYYICYFLYYADIIKKQQIEHSKMNVHCMYRSL